VESGRLFVSEVLAGKLLGIAELETGDHVVRFYHRDMGLIDRRGRSPGSLRPARGLRELAEPASNSKLSGIIPVQSVDNQPG
jgi:hypothetical protein